MLDPAIATALNRQINTELAAWYGYLAMPDWCDAKHLFGFAAFLDAQSREEQEHARRLIQYLRDRGGRLELARVEAPRREFDSLGDVFEAALEQERHNTSQIHALYDLAKTKNDYPTVSALQWFLDEQVEEEKTMDEALGLVRFAGEDRSALLTLNEQFGRRAAGDEVASVAPGSASPA